MKEVLILVFVAFLSTCASETTLPSETSDTGVPESGNVVIEEGSSFEGVAYCLPTNQVDPDLKYDHVRIFAPSGFLNKKASLGLVLLKAHGESIEDYSVAVAVKISVNSDPGGDAAWEATLTAKSQTIGSLSHSGKLVGADLGTIELDVDEEETAKFACKSRLFLHGND